MRFIRRDFLKISGAVPGSCLLGASAAQLKERAGKRDNNSPYRGLHLNRIAFPIGGIGAGMICLEGTGAFSHFSLRNKPDIFNEPCTFAAVSVKGLEKGAKVLEGPVPEWKIFGMKGTGNGAGGTSYGFPRFQEAEFEARFPFAFVRLSDPDIPIRVLLTGWSPFIPGDADSSSLPVGGFEYEFENTANRELALLFSYNAKNLMTVGKTGNSIRAFDRGFILAQAGSKEKPQEQGEFAAFVDDPAAAVDHCWFRGGWWDSVTMVWKTILEHQPVSRPPVAEKAPGASVFVPFSLKPGEKKTVRLMFAWFVPQTDLRYGDDPQGTAEPKGCEGGESRCCPDRKFDVPWYAGRFASVEKVAEHWRANYDGLKAKSAVFRDAFYDTTLPQEVVEAVAANLTILKSPTVRRQCDGRLWCFEGCGDDWGCCHGSCTHVWNYAQAIPHLFPDLERSLREAEFRESQDERGHQTFRTALPIRPTTHTFHAAADGQLGGIMKVYREWRISGDTDWLKRLWPRVRQSLDYCILTWDPGEKGVVEEPHHNTYDIEFWGPDGMCTSFYLGALSAAVAIGSALGEDTKRYTQILQKGRAFMEKELFDGEYFIQRIKWQGLKAKDPVEASKGTWNSDYSPEAVELLQKEGPKYQYGKGCLSDGVLGFWLAQMAGLGQIINQDQIRKNLKAIHRYNLKKDLTDHSNPQRPSYAMGNEGGLLLCTWPKGGQLSLPFVYSNEVWTGIEYQVASHLMLEGMVEEGLDIVRTCRERYDGTIRNPFDEYECGHWYARALSSYGLIQGLTGVRYDAVERTLYIDSRIGNDFRAFLATASGFGTVGLKAGRPFVQMKSGRLDVRKCQVGGKEMTLSTD
ncbi:MAG: hypothetical protein EHM61_22860 [Acidobacteria bacterium]|nr:MAG: hypothetical protein EHM61_22860 [Acidobacteriota bacterium]